MEIGPGSPAGIKQTCWVQTANGGVLPGKRPVLADLIADGASEKDRCALRRQGQIILIEVLMRLRIFFLHWGKGKWYQFTASLIEITRALRAQ
jgi:hypothetical protein